MIPLREAELAVFDTPVSQTARHTYSDAAE